MEEAKPVTLEEATDRERELEKPFGRIQWKGTTVCMDIWCTCGELFHIDDEWAFYVKCLKCGKTFYCGTKIELIEMGAEPEDWTPLTDWQQVE